MLFEPTSGQPLPDNAIQRVLFIASNVHVYQIPPLTSSKGFNASSWTSPTQPTAQEIFTARVRILETSIDDSISAVIVLEDANTGDLFAAAPYISTAVVQPALDSSRFFAIRVQSGKMKATLGIGFEDRTAAFDFGIALSEAQKVLGMASTSSAQQNSGQHKLEEVTKQDFSLKEGEKIHIQVGGRARRQPASTNASTSDEAALFSIAPPPSHAKSGLDNFAIAPPPSGKSAQALGFDDGEFGEFQ